ncbi:hypothetical protein Agabi119p4_2568 [Agaricus bisporus var. burnettii]|uniref:F-box domain-containing protein n=1 Tax=Agaricus bisporus var. burnettii TaxID=192524 RepID=A0A8H7F9I4_AGABI|nr:hypothetical protein Agabi119p4_2568 [Agaricus bisporus var. burnettii]
MSCPYCLQTTPGTSSAFTRGKDVDAEIEHVEDLISRLSAERLRLCKKRNEMRSPIYSLPPENLALIFKFACPPLDFSHKYGIDVVAPSIFLTGVGPLEKVVYPRIIGVLSAVSTLWNSTVSSTPSLWTSFVANDMDVHLMKTVLARSGNLPISASITAGTTPSSYQSLVVAPILQEAARIHMLHVRNTSNIWLKEYLSRFANLELLCLQGGMEQDELDLVGSSCTRLVLKRFNCCITLSWSKIQVLHLTHVVVDVCLEILEKCMNLIEFKLKNPTSSRVEGVQLPTSSFTLPHLEVFEWLVDVENPVDCLMLRFTHMPVLNTLIWSEPQTDLIPSDAFSTFFERLPPTLTAVQIQYCVVHSDFTIFSYF